MLILTNIERYKNKPLFDIVIDGEQVLRIHEEVLLQYGLREGDSLTEELLYKIQKSEEFALAKEKSIAFLNRRMRSERELRTMLRLKKFDSEIINSIIAYFCELGFLNDERYASVYTNYLLDRKPVGKALLQQKLRLKGISQNVTKELLNNRVSETKEDELAGDALQQFLRKHPSISPTDNDKANKQKITSFLVRRGFSWQTIYRVLRKAGDQDLTDDPTE